ncbi:MAG TPA: hypothetical protein P5277_00780 [Candidatus Paceibacterota bacterium]|nr:hypothetical protein [Candidatus Paceibacterota bacterium]
MAEKDKITETKVKYNGLFDFKETYSFIYRWLVDEDYWVEEKKYVEEVGGDSKKVEIEWQASKKISDYFKNTLKLNWRIVGMKTVEVEKDGRKVKMNNGSFEVKITAVLVKDWGSQWDSSPAMKFLRGTYDKFVIEGRIKQYEIKLDKDLNELAEQLKAFLVLEAKK